MSNSHNIDVPDEGALETASVPLILAQAWRDRRTGCLQLSQGKNERRIHVRDGSPVAVDTDRDEDTLARFLTDTKLIKASDQIAIERMSREKKCPQASAILALKLLDANELYRALRTVARLQIAETFDWSTGHFRWMPASGGEHAAAKPHDVLALLQQELPRRWGTERLFTALMAVQDVHGDISPRFLKVARKLSEAGEPAAAAIAKLDGSVPLGRVLGDCAGDPLAAATLWAALQSGVLRILDRPSLLGQAQNLDFEVEIDARASAGVGPVEAESAETAIDAKDAARAETLRTEIESLLGQLGDLDHYSALGLEENANAAQIKKAYFKAAKKYHPDALARLHLDDLKDPTARVFARIAEAFETLSDPDKKAAYDAGGSEEPEIDTARLAQAETSFRKGEILAKMGNFAGALEYLTPAVELWPEEPAYQAELGWALYKQPQSDLALATEHLETALSQAPEDARIHYRLGMVARASGDTRHANDLIAKARAIDPDVGE